VRPHGPLCIEGRQFEPVGPLKDAEIEISEGPAPTRKRSRFRQHPREHRQTSPGSIFPPPASHCVVQAKRNADVTVTISKEGFEPQIIPLTKEIPGTGAAGFAGNILLGGLVGMGVDAATGAATDHKPNPVIVTLQPVAPVARPVPPPRVVRPRPAVKPPEAGT
jgi:hypothetical protein